MPKSKSQTLKIDPTWQPTPEPINALPEPLRRSIHDLETNTDSAGGGNPRWRRDGRELFYTSADGKMMVDACLLLLRIAESSDASVAIADAD